MTKMTLLFISILLGMIILSTNIIKMISKGSFKGNSEEQSSSQSKEGNSTFPKLSIHKKDFFYNEIKAPELNNAPSSFFASTAPQIETKIISKEEAEKKEQQELKSQKIKVEKRSKNREFTSTDHHLDDLGLTDANPTPIETTEPRSVLNYTVDVGIFFSEAEVIKKVNKLQKEKFNAYFIKTKLGKRKAYLVRVGFFDNQEAAEKIALQLDEKGIKSEVLPIVD